MKRLPKTLSRFRGEPLHEEIHKNLTRLTGDGRARIVYGLYDTAQKLPHCATVLLGRDIVAWVLRLGRHNDSATDAGEITRELMETILPAPDQEKLQYLIESHTELPLLNQTVSTLEERIGFNNRPENVERHRTRWNAHTCERLVSNLGMVEIIPEKMLSMKSLARPHDYDVGVLVPCEKEWAWEEVTRGTARSRAEWELKTPAFWNLPKRRHDFTREGIPFHGVAFSDAFPEMDGKMSSSFIVSLIELTSKHLHPTKGQVEVIATRHNSDRHWSLKLNIDGVFRNHRTYAIISGQLLVGVVELAALQGELPPETSATDNLDVSGREFQGAVDRVHERQRELKFVCEALGITKPAQTTPEAAS